MRRWKKSDDSDTLKKTIIEFEPCGANFMLKKEVIQTCANDLTATGYKLLLDIITVMPKEAKITEVPYDMRHRVHGESKLDTLIVLEYLNFLIEKTIGKYIPARFIMQRFTQ